MNYFTTICFLYYFLLPVGISGMSDFTGKYMLTNIWDSHERPIILPADRDFQLEIQSNGNSGQFLFFLKIGNTLRSTFTVNEGDSVSFGMVMSTRMYPGPELAEVESAVSRILPSCVHIENRGVLSIKGSEGKLEFQSAPEAQA